MGSKFLNVSTDDTLGGSSASDSAVPSQKAVKGYVDSHQVSAGVTIDTTQTITGAKTFGGTINIDNNFTGSGYYPAIKFSSNGTSKGFLYWSVDGSNNTSFAFTNASYTLETLRVKTQDATDNSNNAATTKWCRSSNVHTPLYKSGTAICTQANYSTNLPYTCTENGWIMLAVTAGSAVDLQVNSGYHIRTANYNVCYYKVANGDVISYSSSGGAWEVWFVKNR